MTIDILAYGEAMVEFNQRIDNPLVYWQGFGGDTSNFCIAAARQGATTGYLSALGDDAFGQKLRDLWCSEGVNASNVLTDPVAPTGIYFVTHNALGHEFNYLRAGSAASRYAKAHLPLQAIANAKVLHLSGVSLAISESACDAGLVAMKHARQHSVLTSLDTNLRLKLWPLERAREKMRDAFSLCDICLPSWDDISVLTGLDDRDQIVDLLLSYGIKIIAFKLGVKGCYVATVDKRKLIPSHKVDAVDATGAGDCFGGAFIARLVAGDDPFTAASYANICAALSTQGYGAVAPIPGKSEVKSLLESQLF